MGNSYQAVLKLVNEWRNNVWLPLFGCVQEQRRENTICEGNTNHINKSCVCQDDKRNHSAWE